MIKMEKFNSNWKSSKDPSKQRKYRYNAPKHIKSKLLCAPLSKELKEKNKKKSVRVRKGDRVKVLRGQFKGKSGKVERVDIRRERIWVEGVQVQKKEGTKVFYPLHPSKVIITELNLEDKKRKESLMRK